MNTNNAAFELIEKWTALDRAIKQVESATVHNLHSRVDAMMQARKEVDVFIMELSTAMFKEAQ